MLNDSMVKELNILLDKESEGIELNSKEKKRIEYLLQLFEDGSIKKEIKSFKSQICNYL